MTDETGTLAAINAFHAHLDHCSQCMNHPFNLCSEGAKLLLATVPSDDSTLKAQVGDNFQPVPTLPFPLVF
jgi:hypothetical protein